MNTMPTARRGRTYRKSGDNDSRGLGGGCSVILIVALLVLPPALLYGSEVARRARYATLSDALGSDIVELNRPPPSSSSSSSGPPPHLGALVHGTSSHVEASSSDEEMGVTIPGALVLRRNTEYCQWQEIRSQRCDTCSRTVKAKDGSSREESYQCDCVARYDYVKAWRGYRINSLLFDQPGAHHNPQRDPMPSRTFVDGGATLAFREGDDGPEDDAVDDGTATTRADRTGRVVVVRARLDPGMLSSGVRGWPYRVVEFTRDGDAPAPSLFSRFLSFLGVPPRNTRYEPLRLLRDARTSIAAVRDNFVYVGQGGYFFSPVEKSTAGRLFNYFAQYLEGSLFDWQVGDLMPSCAAGDVRFRYEVQDPAVVSVLGRAGRRAEGGAMTIAPAVADATVADGPAGVLGLVHAGRRSARDMLVDEDYDSRLRANVVRGLALLWSIPASRLGGVACGRELGESSAIAQVGGALGLFLVLMGSTWFSIWGGGTRSDGAVETTAVFVAGVIACCLSLRSAYRRGGGRRWRAVWCRVAKWANTPPEWRVEDTYVGGFKRSDGGSGGGGGDARSKKL
ncbi:hypothetical protein ACHAW5_000223 [Stephanodiscus triporus]|uniref:Uncharacterized protein n=1 Tax=Stephanodiscus triporus TaxID=2934178 RepID=A0ABD3QPT5_9STRA